MPFKIESSGEITMLEKFRNTIEAEFPNLNEKDIFLAVSGGKDSMTLSHLLLQLGISHTILHVNFQLRDSDSDLDEDFVINYAKKHKLSFYTKKYNTKKIADEWKLSIQETARKLRYDWFKTFMKNDKQVLMTAHHLDDSIETFFINLMRGTSIQGLTGIEKINKHIYRPLLTFSLSEILNYINENKIEFRQDESNLENYYLRNNLRNQIIPELQKNSPSFQKKVSGTINSLQEIQNWIFNEVNEFKTLHFITENNEVKVRKSLLQKKAPVFLEFLFKEYGVRRSNRKSFMDFLQSKTGSKFITDTHLIVNDRKFIFILAFDGTNEIFQPILITNFPVEIKESNMSVALHYAQERLPFNINAPQQLDLDKVKLPLIVRKWSHGDRIQPLGMKGSKLVSDILIDLKFSLQQKNNVLVIEDRNKQLISIPGLMISEKVKLNNHANNILRIATSKK